MKTVAASVMAVLWLGTSLVTAAPVYKEPGRVMRIITGDTLTILYQGKWEEIKLLGLDMPETTLNDRVYEKALKNSTTPAEIINRGLSGREFVKKYLQYGSQIWIEFDVQKRDHFSRLLGYVYLADGRMLNEIILKSGLSEPLLLPPNLKYQQRFQELARQAQKDKNKPKADKANTVVLK
ncbi:MAG: thermonuclease family protein [Candidatus Aminicenantes bacterium]|nr:thermonuclease family protein [Candidatus Aminicenantes bacterium]